MQPSDNPVRQGANPRHGEQRACDQSQPPALGRRGRGEQAVRRQHRIAAAVVGVGLAISTTTLGQEPAVDLDTTLARAGAQLQRRYERAQRIVSTETVSVRSFTHEMRSNGRPRRLEYERRLEWRTEEDGVPVVRVFRELRSVNGREPQQADRDACLTPLSEVDDPLWVLLPTRQAEFEYSLAALERIDGRLAARLDYVPRERAAAEIGWDEDCVSISLPGWYRGEAWVDVASGDVLRLDEHLRGRLEFREPQDRSPTLPGTIALERSDLSIRYRAVAFENPTETLMLPDTIDRSWTIRGRGFVPRYFRTHEFSDHRRFVTSGRLLSDDPVRE